MERLGIVLAMQPEDVQARYSERRPAETLAFFGIEPGMTVVEVLPGGGWYSKILLTYLGEEGRLVGVDYPVELFELFGFMNEAQVTAKQTWVEDWTRTAEGWRESGDAAVGAFALGDMPTAQDNVWRLPPNLRTSANDPELRASMQEIGESHRMALKFRKPD